MAEGKADITVAGTGGPAIKPVLCLVILFLVLALAAGVAVTVYFLVGVVDSPGSGDGDAMPFQGVLGADGDYRASWTSDAETITVTIVGRTRGWVGFGISGTGGMKEADIMMAWVDDSGTGHIVDTYSEQNGAPVVDTLSQDWKLLESSEDGESTQVKVRRFLRLCDPANHNITSGTLKVIWALGGNDPASETSLGPYHGIRRGTASRRLLDPPAPSPELPKDSISIDFFNENVALPSNSDTTYWCRVVPVPELKQKHHFIMIEPVIQAGNELFVHHILLYVCYGIENGPQSLLAPEGFNCLQSRARRYCNFIIAAWAIGGTAQHFPDHVGIPLGEADSPKYLMVETHYDNPHFQAGVVDTSGLRMWLTPSLRQYDASVLWTGMDVDELHIVPAGAEDFVTAGHCTEQCLRQGLAGLDNGIHIFAGFLHTHLAGVSAVLRHIRNGTELRPIMEDRTYDFDYQNIIDLDEEVTLLPGDRLVLECGYTTKDRNTTTYGGLGTFEEMCLAFLYHYPVAALKQCTSVPSVGQLVKAIPGAAIRWDNADEEYYFTAPAELAGQPVLGAMDYLLNNVPGSTDALQKVSLDGGIYSLCMRLGNFDYGLDEVSTVETPYVENLEECRMGTDGFPTK